MGPWGRRVDSRRQEISILNSDDATPSVMAELQSSCEQCSAVLAFDPENQSVTCQYCGTTNEIENSSIEIREHDLTIGLIEAEQTSIVEQTMAVTCASCEAVFSFDIDLHAGECPFCGHAIVKGSGPHRHIKPTAVLPFARTQRDAKQGMQTWLKGLWFAPTNLNRMAQSDGGLHGIYLPYWTFDSDVQAGYRGQRGDLYLEPQRVYIVVNGKRRAQTQMVQKVRWRPARGEVKRHFNDVLVLASKSLPDWMAARLGPWDLGALRPYTPLFIQGFQAQSYNLLLKDGFKTAEKTIKTRITADIRAHIGGDLQRISTIDLDHDNTRFKHILLPLWLGVYRFGKRTYHVSVNGQTGEVQGERPYSWIKLTAAILLAGLLIAILLFLISLNQT